MMFNLRWGICGVLAALLCTASLCVAVPKVHVKALERIPATANVRVSPGGAYRCYYVKKGNGAEIFVNGRLESTSDKLFRDCACEGDGHIDFEFSYDGAHYAYLISRNGKNVVMVDGKEMPGTPSEGWFRLSPLGRHYWFREGNNSLIVDGIHYTGEAGSDGVTFSRDDREWAAALDDRNTRRTTLLRNGKTIFTADGIADTTFLPDGRLCWTALTRPENRDEWATTGWTNDVYLEGKRLYTLDWNVFTNWITATPDGRHMGIVLVQDPADAHLTTIMVDGKKSRQYPGSVERLYLAPDGSHLAEFTRTPTEYRVIYNHMVGQAFKRVWGLKFSPSGKHYAYFGEVKPDEWVLMVDGGKVLALPGKTLPRSLVWTADDRPLPVYQSRDQRYLTVGERTYGPYSHSRIGGVRISADARCLYPVFTQGLSAREVTFYLDGAQIPGVTFSALTDDFRVAGSIFTATVVRRHGREQELLHVTIDLNDSSGNHVQ